MAQRIRHPHRGKEPHQVHEQTALSEEFWRLLEREGVERAWPRVRRD